MNETNLIYDFIIENELTSEDALNLLTRVSGYNVEILNNAIYCLTAYHDIEQLWNCEKDNFYFNDDIKDFYELEE